MQEKWSLEEARSLFHEPFPDLLHRAQSVHRCNFDSKIIQISTLLSIKTGSCPENCAYCPQSAHYKTGVAKESLLDVSRVVEAAQAAKQCGATRFCMGAAWRSPRDADLEKVCLMVSAVRELGLETCAALGFLTAPQAARLKEAGLDFYNHNVDSSPEFYEKVVTTRLFSDRLTTLSHVRKAGIKVCCGGILGMGETTEDRLKMLVLLANFDEQPESVPINRLVRVAGTPLCDEADLDSFEFVRTIALSRIMMPRAYVRLSAGRGDMSDELQALCFLAGANSLFYGEKLLTTKNSTPEKDDHLLSRLGLKKKEWECEKDTVS